MTSVPLRTCIGCYRTAVKKELFRIVCLPDNSMVVDLDGKKDGRGAYICPDIDCVSKAMRLEKLNKAFRIAPNLISQITPDVVEKTRQNLLELIKH